MKFIVTSPSGARPKMLEAAGSDTVGIMDGLDPQEVGARLRALGRGTAGDIRIEDHHVVLTVAFAGQLATRLDRLEQDHELLTETAVEFLHSSQRLQRRLSRLRAR
jgi:hypothetical protein